MRILLINNLFAPEPNHLKGMVFARELVRRGHAVHVLTGFPSYPGGKLYPGWKLQWTRTDEEEGVRIVRAAAYLSHDRSSLRRVLSYTSLGASQTLHLPALRERFDVAHVYLGPLPLMWPALALRALHGTRIVADVQDLWPESVADSGMLRSRIAERFLLRASDASYRAADRIVVLSPGYRDVLVRRGIDPGRIDVVYNWRDESVPLPARIAATRSDEFVLAYAGNMGRLQALDVVLEAAKLLSVLAPQVRIVLAGDGVEASRLRRRVEEEGIANVKMLGRLSSADAASLVARADASLIHVADTELMRLGIPQKVQSCLAAGRPVVIASRGEAARLVSESGGGIVCDPGDPRALAQAVETISALSDRERDVVGSRGAEFYARKLSFRTGVDRMLAVFEATLSRGRVAAQA